MKMRRHLSTTYFTPWAAVPHRMVELRLVSAVHIFYVRQDLIRAVSSSLGFDRLVATLCNASSIRDVIAFPKTSAGTDALLRSPTPINRDILHQYGIRPRR